MSIKIESKLKQKFSNNKWKFRLITVLAFFIGLAIFKSYYKFQYGNRIWNDALVSDTNQLNYNSRELIIAVCKEVEELKEITKAIRVSRIKLYEDYVYKDKGKSHQELSPKQEFLKKLIDKSYKTIEKKRSVLNSEQAICKSKNKFKKLQDDSLEKSLMLELSSARVIGWLYITLNGSKSTIIDKDKDKNKNYYYFAGNKIKNHNCSVSSWINNYEIVDSTDYPFLKKSNSGKAICSTGNDYIDKNLLKFIKIKDNLDDGVRNMLEKLWADSIGFSKEKVSNIFKQEVTK